MRRDRLLRLAREAGLEIRQVSASWPYPIVIVRYGERGVMVTVLANGTASRPDQDGDKSIRMSLKEAAWALGLHQDETSGH